MTIHSEELNFMEGFDRRADGDDGSEQASQDGVVVRWLNLGTTLADGSKTSEGILLRTDGGSTDQADVIVDEFVKTGLYRSVGWTNAENYSVSAVWAFNSLISATDFADSDTTDPERRREFYRSGRCKVIGCHRRSPHWHNKAYASRLTLVANEDSGWPASTHVGEYDDDLGPDEQQNYPHYVLLDLDPSKRIAQIMGRRPPRLDVEATAAHSVAIDKSLVLLRYDLSPLDVGTIPGTKIRYASFAPSGDTHRLTQIQVIPRRYHAEALDNWSAVRSCIKYLHDCSTDAFAKEASLQMEPSFLDEL